MTVSIVRAFAVSVVLCAIGCRDSTGPRSIVAIYRLQTVDGVPLPDVRQETPTRIELIARTLTLYDDGTLTDSSEYREVTGSGAIILSGSSSRDRWERHGTRIDITFDAPEYFPNVIQCDVEGDLLTCGMMAGATFVYRKDPPPATSRASRR